MKRVAIALIALLLLGPAIFAKSMPKFIAFHDQGSGLVIHYPANWHRDLLPKAILTIDSFPEKKRPAQYLVPVGGASITISGEQGKPIEDVVKLNALTPQNGYRRQEIELSTAAGEIVATEFRAEPEAFPEGFWVVDVFIANGQTYKAVLFYRGATYKEKFEGIYSQILRTIEFPK
jgi:hypothetical protein